MSSINNVFEATCFFLLLKLYMSSFHEDNKIVFYFSIDRSNELCRFLFITWRVTA